MVNIKKTFSLSTICVVFLATTTYAAQVTLLPRLNLSETYTDNVFRTSDNIEEDWIFRFTPGATLDIQGRKSGLSLSYDASYASYHNFTEKNQWSHRADLDSFAQFTRNTRGYFTDAFLYTEDPGVDESVSGRQGREPYFVNTAVVGVTHQFGQRDLVDLQFRYREFIDTATVADDSTLYTPAFSSAWWFVSDWGLALDLALTRGLFELSDDFYYTWGRVRLINELTRHLNWSLQYQHIDMRYDEGLSEDYQVFYPGFGVDYTYSPTTRAALDLGYLWREYEDRSDDAGWTLFGEAETGVNLRRVSLGVSWMSGLDFDYASTDNLGLYYYSQAGAVVDWQVARTVSADVSASYRYVEYVDLDPNRIDRIAGAGAGVAWTAATCCTLRLEYAYFDRDSTDDFNTYAENRVIFRVTFEPAKPVTLMR